MKMGRGEEKRKGGKGRRTGVVPQLSKRGCAPPEANCQLLKKTGAK